MPRKRLKPPICQHCPDVEAVLALGPLVVPRRGDLATQWFWRCPDCGAYCACQKGTKKALGRPANQELRAAQEKLLRDRINPIWTGAADSVGYDIDYRDTVALKMVTNAARKRTYAWLADKLDLGKDCHVAMFDLEQCRAAWRALTGVDYVQIRDWFKSREAGEIADRTNEQAARL